MEGVFLIFTLAGTILYLCLVVASTIIASRKGRSAIGWCFLTILFPIAILFVSIAAPIHASEQGQSARSGDIANKSLSARNFILFPPFYGLIALIPMLISSRYTDSSLDGHLGTLGYMFCIIWLAAIGIINKDKNTIFMALTIYIVNKALRLILYFNGMAYSFNGIADDFAIQLPLTAYIVFGAYENLVIIDWLTWHLGWRMSGDIICFLYALLAIPIYMCQRKLRKASANTP